MKSIPENIQLSKDLFHRFPWSTECLTHHPEFTSGSVRGQQLQQHRQMVNALADVIQAPLFLEFSWQEYWSALPFPSPGDLLEPGIQPGSPALWEDSLLTEVPGKTRQMLLASANL